MAGEKHLLLELGGSYSPASNLGDEIWICTLRFALVDGTVDDSGTLPSNWDVVTNPINRTEALWTITGNWRAQDAPNQFNVDDWLNDQVAPAATAWMAQSSIANSTILRTLKAYPIGSPLGRSIPNPDQTQGSPILLTWAGIGPQGGGGAPPLPPQDSLVVSHRTDQLGRKGRGRMYLPGNSASILTAGGLAGTGAVNASLAAQIAFLEAASFSGSGANPWNVRPIVTGKPYVHYGTINHVKVGNVIDTQQRRRDRLTEVYTSGDVTY